MNAVSSILDEIVAYKRGVVADARGRVPEETVRACADSAAQPASLFEALTSGDDIAVIAEIKKASPSKGLIREDFDPVTIGVTYEAHGASAISLLTDEKYFQGSADFLTAVHEAVRLPLLRKDFTVDGYQIYEARAIGASAVLLIVAALEDALLRQFLEVSRGLDLDAVVEVHTESEGRRAVDAGAEIVGINNRDLHTFDTTLETTERVARLLPEDTLIVSESGIGTRADVIRVRDAGADAVLVGESLMRETDIGLKLRELLGEEA